MIHHMKRIYLTIFLLLFVFCSTKSQQPARTVNFSTPISGVANFDSIADAISGLSAPGTIWVAIGNYTEEELIVPSGITLIGGFPGNATSLNDRIYPGRATPSQQSVLDGQYEHRVATVYGTLDGFVITKGYAFDTISGSIKGAGGGLLIDGGTVMNCIIHNNVASELEPEPGIIPGTFVGSIGDIYCTDGTIIQPTYSINSQGKVVASLSSSDSLILSQKTPQGIIFYVDPAPTTGRIHVMGKILTTNNDKRMWFNPPIDAANLPNMATLDEAMEDFNGRSNSDSLTVSISQWIQDNTPPSGIPPWYEPNYALKYIEAYNTPAGTLGEWHLPAGGELYKMWEVFPQMDACARDILKWIEPSASMFPKGMYVSSTECDTPDTDRMWGLDTNSYPWGGWGLAKRSKTERGFIVPVTIKYQSLR